MKVFLDTNVFLDMLVRRDDISCNENALTLLQIARSSKFEFCVSPLTVATTYYVARHTEDLAGRMKEILSRMTILPVGEDQVRFSVFFDYPDREDSMQMSCALDGGCDVILTRNMDHFRGSPVFACSPAEFIGRVSA